jgi:hypothetical protein
MHINLYVIILYIVIQINYLQILHFHLVNILEISLQILCVCMLYMLYNIYYYIYYVLERYLMKIYTCA